MTFSYFAARRLPSRYAAFVMPFVLSILMSLIVSGVSTLIATGRIPASESACKLFSIPRNSE